MLISLTAPHSTNTTITLLLYTVYVYLTIADIVNYISV